MIQYFIIAPGTRRAIAYLLFVVHMAGCTAEGSMPNVVFVLTDDQGYGDLACHGNPWLKTPHLDRLYERSIRFTDFHAGTTCAPTRAGLMTGKYCNKVGVWHTINGRSLLRKGESTLASVLKEAGYTTAIFGKWHLGDNYPFRPQDRGFDEVLIHGGGGIGQTPDYWNNDYFDDTYFHNGTPERYEGYCTDIFFDEAIRWMRSLQGEPFFCYIATNAPHAPLYVEERYSEPYKGVTGIKSPQFYGMIANIDENVGKLVAFLREKGLAQNTILVFMTDNGTYDGALYRNGTLIKGYNAGMRGLKGSPFEGGHRVPFFLSWDSSKTGVPRDVATLSSYVDFMPTILDLCGISTGTSFDGKSLRSAIEGIDDPWPERILIVDTQREEILRKNKPYAVMWGKWRLVNGALYDLTEDPGQQHDVADRHPDIVHRLSKGYDMWWEEVSVHRDEYQRIEVVVEHLPMVLTSHDMHVVTGYPAWSQRMVREGTGENGYWAIRIAEAGRYLFELMRWPPESGLALAAPAPAGDQVPGDEPFALGRSLCFTNAALFLNDKKMESAVDNKRSSVAFEVSLSAGNHDLRTSLTDVSGDALGAYYVRVSALK